MWFERFDIIAIVLSKGHLPSTGGVLNQHL